MVLILVVMKDTNCKNVEREIDVLILIIMEDTHGESVYVYYINQKKS